MAVIQRIKNVHTCLMIYLSWSDFGFAILTVIEISFCVEQFLVFVFSVRPEHYFFNLFPYCSGVGEVFCYSEAVCAL